MGVLYQGAANLGLLVDVVPQQNELEYLYEPVLSIEPPPGTVVAKGATVTVTIDVPA
jgi:hypothetical protein